MKFVRFDHNGKDGLAVDKNGTLHGLTEDHADFPGTLDDLVSDSGAMDAAGKTLAAAPAIDRASITLSPPLTKSSKVLCVGLNYSDHTEESGYDQPEFPTVFGRFASMIIADGASIVRPNLSETLDYEGELVAVIGTRASKVSEEDALSHVAGYTIFNDGSIREYQHKTPQWTVGKNFDNTGSMGPCFVSADDLPEGCLGLTLETRLNGQVVQNAKIDNMVFSIKTLISMLSQAMTLEPGDLIVSGTPSGVGGARKPPLWMKPGDTVEVEIDQIGILTNPIVAED